MQVKLFYIGISQFETGNEELNKFLRSKKILNVESSFVSQEKYCGWAFTVQFLDIEQSKNNPKEKIDFKKELDEPTFAKFSKLRECRKLIFQAEGIPAYAVFTDSELAAIAKLEEITVETIKKLDGFGDGKMERFGKKLLELYEAKGQSF